MEVYLDGRFVPANQASVSVFAGGYLHGDGVYTTLRLYGGRAPDLAAHWERLRRHAQALELPLSMGIETARAVIGELALRNGLTEMDGRLRLTVSRGGEPGRPLPLKDLDQVPSTVLFTLLPVAPEIAAWQRAGIAVVVLGPAYARSHFPELKTLNSLTAVLAQRQAARLGCQEALLTAPQGRLLEGAVSNLFLVRGGVLLTPCAEGHFLPGRTRELIFSIAADLGIPAREEPLSTTDLRRAEEVFMASSVREVLPVVSIDRRPVADGLPGPLTRRMQEAYRRTILNLPA